MYTEHPYCLPRPRSHAATLPMGEGEVVFLVDNTQYRMFWIGPARMMQNAVMLVPGML